MFNGWLDGLLVGIKTINNILTAGIAITAFSLFLYALSFNLRDRVARSFAIILLCVVVVFTTEALQNKSIPDWGIELLLRLQWVGIIFLPPSYLHLSDALLVTAGRPSRGRRRLAVRLVYVVSLAFLALLSAGMLVGSAGANANRRRTCNAQGGLISSSPFITTAIIVLGGSELYPCLRTDVDALGPATDVVPDGRRDSPGARFLSIFVIWFGSGSPVSTFFLEHGFTDQHARCDPGHHHGVCGRILWRVLAGSRRQESSVQVAAAWTRDGFACARSGDDRPPGRLVF
jgi:hypothetical protein